MPLYDDPDTGAISLHDNFDCGHIPLSQIDVFFLTRDEAILFQIKYLEISGLDYPEDDTEIEGFTDMFYEDGLWGISIYDVPETDVDELFNMFSGWASRGIIPLIEMFSTSKEEKTYGDVRQIEMVKSHSIFQPEG